MRVSSIFVAAVLTAGLSGCNCNGDGSDSGMDGGTDTGTDSGITMCPATANLDMFLPGVPAPTGDPQAAFAGMIADSTELIGGLAATGQVGDYFLRNDRVRFIIQRPNDFFWWGRYGGTVIDADIVRGPADPGGDQFGKLSPFYRSGRTIGFDSCEVLQDGSGGGAAAIRCTGTDKRFDAVNFPSFVPGGFLDIPLDPHFETPLDAAATYILEPGADHVQVHWTFFNREVDPIQTNFGYFADTGGEIELFTPNVGFGAASLADIFSGGDVSTWVGYWAPEIAYGVVPHFFGSDGNPDPSIRSAHISVSGLSIAIFGVGSLLEGFSTANGWLVMDGCDGFDQRLDFVVSGTDLGAVGSYANAALGVDTGNLSGTVLVNGAPAEGVRVAALLDRGATGTLDDPDVTGAIFKTDANGDWGGDVPVGDYLVTTHRPGLELDPAYTDGAAALTVASGASDVVDFDLPAPGIIEYDITDAMTGSAIPGRILIVGDDPSPKDRRFRDHDEASGEGSYWELVNQARFSITGSSVTEGGIEIEAGTYRVFVSRGTEWSIHDEVINVTAGATTMVTASLTHVIDTTGYIAADFHQHGVNSMDAPTTHEERVMVYAAEGIEFIGASDHDFLTDYEPIIAALGASALMESTIGIETTTFDFGHYNAFPLTIDPTHPYGGNFDWGNGDDEFNLAPPEIFMEMRMAGASVIQVNHPREGTFAYFDPAGLVFDYTNGYVGDDPSGMYPTPLSVLRLPPGSIIFDPSFDTFEVWNGLRPMDTNADGVLEDALVDVLMLDWFRFTAFGFHYTGMANSDSHKFQYDFGGYPRTYVAVADDTAIGTLEGEILDNVAGTGTAPRDVVLTNAPFLRVSADGGASSAIGATVDGSSGMVTLTISVESIEEAPIDTLELFINTDDADGMARFPMTSALIPTVCFTDRIITSPDDTCDLATAGPAMPLGVAMTPVGSETIHTVTMVLPLNITADTFVFVRASGNTGVFALLPEHYPDTLLPSDVVAGTASFDGTGIPAMAIAGPVLIDFDGNGVYDAPYAP